jgi:hypothetical protein
VTNNGQCDAKAFVGALASDFPAREALCGGDEHRAMRERYPAQRGPKTWQRHTLIYPLHLRSREAQQAAAD